jgi:hypothetical protein
MNSSTKDCKPFFKTEWLMPKPLMIRMTFLESPNAYSHTHQIGFTRIKIDHPKSIKLCFLIATVQGHISNH